MPSLIVYLIADLVVRVLPSRAADALARALARLAFALRVPARRAMESNLVRLCPDSSKADPERVRAHAREAFEQFALSFTDFLRLARLPGGVLESTVELRGREHLDRARASGRGVIVLSAHVGNWEWGAAYLAALGTRVHVAARPHSSPRVEAFFARRRSSWGVALLRDRPLWIAASRALRRREWVALMGDRRATGASGSMCAWAGALARRTGAVVLPAVMLRLGAGRYAACFEPPLSPEACAQGGVPRSIRGYLERDPGQWFAFEPLPEGLA